VAEQVEEYLLKVEARFRNLKVFFLSPNQFESMRIVVFGFETQDPHFMRLVGSDS